MLARTVFFADAFTAWINANIVPIFQNALFALFALAGVIYIFNWWRKAKDKSDEPGPELKGLAIGLVILLAYANIFAGLVPAAIEGPGDGGVGPPVENTYKIVGTVTNFWTNAALGGTKAEIDVIRGEDWSKPYETIVITTSSKTFNSNQYYEPGEVLWFHVLSTEDSGYYDKTFQITLPETVTGGDTPYLALDPIGIKERSSAAELTMVLSDPLGNTLSSGDGDTAESKTGVAAGSTMGLYDAPNGGQVFSLKLTLYLSAYSVSWGAPMTTLASNEPYERQTRVAVVWLAFNNTAISKTGLMDKGWSLISNQPDEWVVFYKTIPEIVSSRSELASKQLEIPMDVTSCTADKNVTVKVFFQDLALESNAAMGTVTSAPTAYGAFNEYGLTAILPATGYYQTTSGVPGTGAGTGAWLVAHVETPAS